MQTLLIDYEAFYGLAERPFSLTSEPRFHFRSRSHARAMDLVAAESPGRRDGLVLITGETGTGKTLLARALAAGSRCGRPTAYVPHPLLAPEDLLRMLLQGFGAVSAGDAWGRLSGVTQPELRETLRAFLRRIAASGGVATALIDEAQSMPPAIVGELLALDALEAHDRRLLRVVLVGRGTAGSAASLANRQVDQRVSARARLLPLERDECGAYVDHRLIAAGGGGALFTPRAIDTVYELSGGVPRLVNLLCERALHEGALVGTRHIESPLIDRAAAELELGHARPRRFRWFGH